MLISPKYRSDVCSCNIHGRAAKNWNWQPGARDHWNRRWSCSLGLALPVLARVRAARRAVEDRGDAEHQELQRLRFRGVSLLFGAAALQRLKHAHAAVLGIGGVGSWVVESLARSGIGGLTLVDLDEICISNTNRQLHTLADTVGRAKVDVMAERVRLINPDCNVETVQDFFVEETEHDILDSRPFDVVVDAIDGVANKCRLIYACRERQIPIVVSGGLGGKADPTMFCTDDMTRVHGRGRFEKFCAVEIPL